MKRQREAPCNATQMLLQRGVTGGRALRRKSARAPHPEDSLAEWAETELLRHCSSTYCNNSPPLPRSTIALAFSPDGKLLASTHGDHTVKITCCRTGACLRVLRDHERTPWVVKFHPRDSSVLASGSLDSHVRVWDVPTGSCMHSYNFGRPISSLDFHADGDELAVASGHRMYLWKYGAECVTAAQRLAIRPVLMLKTRRSLRAVHFHPQGAPLILTAEVSSGSRSTRNPIPLDVTGVVNGVETEDRRNRHRPRPHATARDRNQPRDSTAFGEQLSQALRELQASSQTESPPREDEDGRRGADCSPSGTTPGRTAPPLSASPMPWTQEGSGPSDPRQGRMWRELYARRILNPQERVTYPPGAPEWFNQSPFERFLDNRRRFRDLALDSQPEGAVSGPPAPPGSTPPQRTPASADRHRGGVPSADRRQEAGEAASARGEPRERTWRAQTQADCLRLLAQQTAEGITTEADDAFPAANRTGGLGAPPVAGPGGRSSAIDNLVRLAELLEFDAPEAPTRPIGEAGPSRHGTARSSGSRGRSRGDAAEEAPQRVLQRISSGGGTQGGSVDPPPAQPWPANLEDVIDSRWTGARPAAAERERTRGWGLVSADLDEAGHPGRRRPVGGDSRVPAVAPAEGLAGTSGAEGARAERGAGGPLPSWPQPVLDALAESTRHPILQQPLGLPPPATFGRQPPQLQDPLGVQGLQGSRREAGVQATGLGDTGGRNGRDAHGHTSRSAGKEVGCHVLVRLWVYEREGGHPPCLGALKLAIHNTVLCSDMGVTISPCGRLLALCTTGQEEEVCKEEEGEGVPLQYRLSIYSLAGSNFGEVVQSRPIKAAHCLTAIQFSPASCHILLAYGRRDPSLQRNLNGDALDSMLALHTVLELYRVHDLSIVRLLPSADDEINTAAFHPFVGEGLAYGTKEGRLRILTHSSCPLMGAKDGAQSGGLEEELLAAAQEASSHTSEDERDG